MQIDNIIEKKIKNSYSFSVNNNIKLLKRTAKNMHMKQIICKDEPT